MGSIFKMKTRSKAILSENDQRTVIPIPAKATVVLVGGDMDEMHSSSFAMGAGFS